MCSWNGRGVYWMSAARISDLLIQRFGGNIYTCAILQLYNCNEISVHDGSTFTALHHS